jgi:myosin heavy subunit
VEKRRERSTLASEVERMQKEIVAVSDREVKARRAADEADARLIKVEGELRRANDDADDAITTAQAEISRLRAMQDEVREETDRLRMRGEDDVAMLQRKVAELTIHAKQLDDLNSQEDFTKAILLYIVKSGGDVNTDVLRGLVEGGEARTAALEAIRAVIEE